MRVRKGFFSLTTSTYKSLMSAVPIQSKCFTDGTRDSTSLKWAELEMYTVIKGNDSKLHNEEHHHVGLAASHKPA